MFLSSPSGPGSSRLQWMDPPWVLQSCQICLLPQDPGMTVGPSKTAPALRPQLNPLFICQETPMALK